MKYVCILLLSVEDTKNISDPIWFLLENHTEHTRGAVRKNDWNEF